MNNNTDRIDVQQPDVPVFRRRRHNPLLSKYEVKEHVLSSHNTTRISINNNIRVFFALEPSQSLDYDVCENALWTSDQRKRESTLVARKDFARWIVFIIIGVLTALIASTVDIAIEEISFYKYGFLKRTVDFSVQHGDLVVPYAYYVLTNVVPVALGSILVTYVEPVAGGSGVPIMKCYLNGIKVPYVVRFKTLLVKVFGVVTSVVGGLAGGKEGPMIHAGAVVAAGVSQGKSTTFRRDFGVFKYFRDDHEKRDFVLGGASAGVAAAFGAPLGGVLFSLEEAASFWNQKLIWQTLVAAIISSFTLNVVLSAYHGLKTFSYPGLFNFGSFEPLPYEYFEVPLFVLMGMWGGISGAAWNSMNVRLGKFRTLNLRTRWSRVLEAVLVAALSATVACAMMFGIQDCRPLGVDPTPHPVQLFCQDNEYNAVAALWFQTPEATVKALFHDPVGSHAFVTLVVFVVVYYALTCVTYGLHVSLGIFIPHLLVGAAWGRLVAMSLCWAFPEWAFVEPSKYALVGAAAQLGGTMRMTISLTVILIESTGNISFALPLIVTLIAAKWMGDYFNEGIYDTQIAVSGVPMLSWQVQPAIRWLKATQIASGPPVVCVRLVERVSYIVEMLRTYEHSGFPVVDGVPDVEETCRPRPEARGRLRGFILRSQLIVILQQRLFWEKQAFWNDVVDIEVFRSQYPRYASIEVS